MPDWLLQLIAAMPQDEQFNIFSELDARSRLFANDFQQEMLDLQYQLYSHGSLKLKTDCFTNYLAQINPAIAPRIYDFEIKAEQARKRGAESALRGFSLVGLR
jgi:hypothetical protein